MASFSASFAPTSFAAAAAGPVFAFTGQPTVALAIQVVSPLVFDSSYGYIKWAVTVTIGGAVIPQLTGDVSISAGEDAARVASFSVIPTSVAQLDSFESALVTIDVTLFRTGQTATMRRFTGIVESIEFSPASRVATLHCRDGYQERPKACTNAAEVESLFGGLAYPSAKVAPWDNDQPDPVAYFNTLQTTMMGACAIDSSGLWRAVPWAIGTPSATFSTSEIYDDSCQISRANRRELPVAIRATLNFRYNRLHCAEKTITWDDPGPTDHLVLGLPTCSKATIQKALEGVPGWIIKGKPTMIGPTPGDHPVIVMGQTAHYIVPYDESINSCEHLSATLYRRWYQQVQFSYTVDIPMGGSSEREDSVNATISSSFDAAAWETTPTTEASLNLYLTNPPTVPVPPTGYEGLPSPFPLGNSALDHHPDVTHTDLQAAARHVVAQALRRAATGKRKQSVRFERPLDPRWEIGSVLAINAYGVVATGQVISFEDRLDHDSGAASSTITLACPDGSGTTTGFTATLDAPTSSIAHALNMPLVINHYGGWTSTPDIPDEDNLVGFLCNVVLSAPAADPDKPSYIAQFRLIMPDIPADVRDPLIQPAAITASVVIAGSGITVSF